MQNITLNDVATVSGGHAFKSEQYTSAGRFILRTVNIRDDYSITKEGANFISETDARNYQRFALEPLDTLFVMVAATLGKIGLVRESDLPALLNQNMWVIRARPGKIDKRYLHYLFREISKIPLSWVGGSARSFLRRDDVRNLQFPLPSLSEQQKIASALAALDDKIELNRQMNETLEAQARALFRDWFVDFGPVKAKIAGDAPYLAPDLWSLFPDRLDDDGVPEGWRYSTIGAEVDALGGSTPSTKNAEFWDGDIAWTTPKDLSDLNSPILLKTSRCITTAGLAKISSGLLSAGTVLLSSRAPVGYLAITQIPLAVNQGYIAMRCERRISNWFAFLWAKQNLDLILRNANGSTFQEISKRNFRPLPVVVASEEVHSAFDGLVEVLFATIAANELESRTLAQTRDLLLPKLMSGEIRVGEVDRALEDAA